MSGRRAPLMTLLRASLAGCALTVAMPATPQPLEQAVKASFLLKFAPFVEWPAHAMGPANRPFTICVSGEDPFGRTLDEVVRGQRVYGRPAAVRRLASEGSLAGCQILFAGKSNTGTMAALGDAGREPILTVSDRKNGTSDAMIQFVMQGGRVRFAIDNNTARTNGLSISSKLLGLAISVDGK